MKKKPLLAILIALLLAVSFPSVSYAADATISTDDSNYNLVAHGHGDNDTITIAAGCAVTLVGDSGTTYTNFQIVCGAGVKLTLKNVNIDNGPGGPCSLSFTGSGNTLSLAPGTISTLTGGSVNPGVRVEDTTSLTIDGTGTLNANGGESGAGIGSARNKSCGTVIINGGTTQALSGSAGGAGIGGGLGGSGGDIIINGGTVSATGYSGGAGIGGGNTGAGGSVSINGGTVTATSSMSYDIGSGIGGAPGGTLSLDGAAYVTLAQNGTNAAVTLGDCYIKDNSTGSTAIADGAYIDGALFTGTVIDVTGSSGGGTMLITDASLEHMIVGNTTGGNVSISSGTSATKRVILFGVDIEVSFGCALDIAGSNVNLELFGKNTLISHKDGCAALHCPQGASLTISGAASLSAACGSNAAAIGSNSGENSGTITIADGTITATGIGGGFQGGGGDITITGGTVTATAGSGSAIGSGHDEPASAFTHITISGGIVHATCTTGAGIGGGINNKGDLEITISGGDVTATSTLFGAGIGGGISDGTDSSGGGGGDIRISGGIVHAYGGKYGPGIGNGAGAPSGAVTNITITGGQVTATSDGDGTDAAAAIGGAQEATGCKIVITGGEVKATAGAGGAAIGGGSQSTKIAGATPYGGACAVEISGGTVYAAGGADADDIGAGKSGESGSLSISGTAAVFLKNDTCVAPTNATHTHLTYTEDTTESYGISIPVAWTPTFGSYLRIYTLTYDANGGTGTAPASVTKLYNATAAMADGSGLTKTGHHFGGWNTKADGGGMAQAAGGAFVFSNNATLYAQWVANQYSVQYDANSGTGTTASGEHTYGVAKALTANGFKKTGHSFAGWAASAGGAAAYADGQSVLNLTDADGATLTLYAVWRPNAYTVRYDANGGTGATASSTHTYGVTKALTAIGFAKANYAFDGWAASAGGAKAYTDGQSVLNLTDADAATVTLYARWKAMPSLTSSDSDGKIFTGGRVTLTPNIEGGTWAFDSAFLSKDGNTFKALKAGTTSVTYTVEGQAARYDVTILEAELPKTGQDFSAVLILLALGALAGAAALAFRRIWLPHGKR